MPTYQQAHFIPRSLASLLDQSLEDWQLIVIDDGSQDGTYTALQPFLTDARIQYYRFEENRGLGAALNFGLARAASPYIAYLPSDDVIYRDHLDYLARLLDEQKNAILVYSSIRHHYNREAEGQIPGYYLQLVQVMHRQVPQRWVERDELVTDNLERMFWSQLRSHGAFVHSKPLTCEWADHPDQRYKILREPEGGINKYRQYYHVKTPIRMHTTVGNYMDEPEHYRRFRERPDTPIAPDGLKILLVGELAYNPERILALEERGHKLYGLWMPDPYWYNYVGPLPFGHVQDLDPVHWKDDIKRIKPDIIYALLNWQAVPFAHQVMKENPGIPFVWHFKEGPFICLQKGSWTEMIELYTQSDGQIYCNPEMQAWFETVIPGSVNPDTSLILDGDLPKRDWFLADRSPRLSDQDGQIHTVVPGRPIGLHPQNVIELAEQGIHLHFYGDFIQGVWMDWIEKTLRLAPIHIHLHKQIDQEDWVREFSKYDAGWLHFFESFNHGEIARANWDDLNYPARISTLLAAGLPLLQRDNTGSIVATQTLFKSLDVGLFFKEIRDLGQAMADRERLEHIRQNAWNHRMLFTFDEHIDELVNYFHKIIDRKAPHNNSTSKFSIPFVRRSLSIDMSEIQPENGGGLPDTLARNQ
jgi:glycosyltransferase involved in cell wall biosynthesis